MVGTVVLVHPVGHARKARKGREEGREQCDNVFQSPRGHGEITLVKTSEDMEKSAKFNSINTTVCSEYDRSIYTRFSCILMVKESQVGTLHTS